MNIFSQYRVPVLLVAAAAMLLGACASTPPELREAPADNPDIARVSVDPDAYRSRIVRWGGQILEIENRSDVTAVTVLALPLSSGGRPQSGDASPGRFIALVPGFLEPTLYSSDRKLTVKGTLIEPETHLVGEFPYRYPVVEVETHYLWPVEPVLSEDNYYPWWWYDPWYYPWSPRYYPRRHLY